MSASAASPPSFDWGCATWADCSCTSAAQKCKCSPASCGCGTITIEQVKEAMEKACPYADCGICKGTCRCNKACACGGSTAKTKEQWVEWVKNNDPAVCKCKAAT